jgi:pimeloyl-ACP methyl ester carboxylesterase
MQLVLLPGLGADHRMFAPQAAAFERLSVPAWILPRDREGLPEYAERFAESVHFSGSGPRVLGGVSLGGMLAYEMARYVPADALVLIATCRTRRGLGHWRRLIGPIVPRAPLGVFRFAQHLAPATTVFRRGRSRSMQRTLVRMFQEADVALMRWALGALLRWQPSRPAALPTFQIHGARDRVIFASGIEADELIPDGGHLINLTHAQRVNAFIRKAAVSVK